MLQHAFKEWSVICRALGTGRQALILRKGGIEEAGGAFRVEHERFWLFPTYVHQQAAGIIPEASALLEADLADRPLPGIVRLSLFAEVQQVFQVATLEQALSLAGLHIWSQETVRARFHYRHPGLFALAVCVFRIPEPIELPNTPHYDGCRSWVELERAVTTQRARAVLEAQSLQERLERVRVALQPP
jgi:hypothetical protein